VDASPFDGGIRLLDEPRPGVSGGPVVRAEAPAGGPVWIVTDPDLARQVLSDPRISKDPAHAPPAWDPRTAGLEPTAAAQPALTTLDGPAHTALRRAHAPLLSARRMQERAERIADIARDLLTGLGTGPVDLVAGFSTDFPLTVLCDLLGVPLDRVPQAAAACRGMHDPTTIDAAMGAFMELAALAVAAGGGLAAELRDRLPPGMTADDLHYQLFALLFAGQLTTDESVGHLIARLLGPERPAAPAADLVHDVLRRHPPAPFTLWRFTTAPVELGGTALPAGAPVLVDIAGITARAPVELAFGAGPHYCIGAQLALVELTALVEVLRADFPQARLAVPHAELRRADRPGTGGGRIVELSVLLR
jgi:cytochrome P450